MNTKKTFLILSGLLLFHLSLFAQDQPKKFLVSGYVTDMQIESFKTLDTISALNLIHNRIDLKWYPTKGLSFYGGIRNRIYFGSPYALQSGFGTQLNNYNQGSLIDLSTNWINKPSFLFNTTVDRLYGKWSKGKWDIRVGRQRINWGKTTIWNPNDWFNTFNYTDFDYPERPGTDAVRVQFYPNGMSDIDLAVSPAKKFSQSVIALRYGFNKWNYDFQVLGGMYHSDVAVGLGWSGNIKNIGFRGEASWFQPQKHFLQQDGDLSATISLDYRTANTWHFQVGALYNTIKNQITTPTHLLSDFTGSLSAKRMMPTEWTLFGDVSKDITPLWHADISVMTGLHPLFLFFMPNMSYSLTQNFDVSIYGQVFAIQYQGKTQNLGNGVYIRFKYNF